MELAQILKKLRKERKMTQKELAAATGISFHAINSYESGRREPNSKAMAALEEFFNVSGAYLRGETDEKKPLTDDEQNQIIIQQSKEELPIFLKRIQKAIQEVSDDELTFTDGILIDFFLTLKKKNYDARSLTLLLMHLSAHISTMFFGFYTNYSKELSKEESIDKAAEKILEYNKEALNYVKKFMQERIDNV